MADTSDYIRGGVFILLFLLTGVRDLQTWLISDLIFTGFTGLMLYFNPNWTIVLQTQDVKVDVIHAQLYRLFAAFLMGPLLFWVLRRKSADSSAKATMLLSRAMGISVLLIVMTVGQLSYGHIFTDKHFWFGFLGNILWFAANIIQLLKERPQLKGVNQPSGITLLLHINGLVLTLLSLLHLAHPNLMCKVQGRKVDKFHIHATRSAGALMMGWSVFSWFSPRFQEKADVKIVFISQLLTFALSEGTYLILHLGSGLMVKRELAIRMMTFSPLAVTALAGIYLCRKTSESVKRN